MRLRTTGIIKGISLLIFLTIFLVGIAGQIHASEPGNNDIVFAAKVDGMINPASERFISSSIRKAEAEGAVLFVVLLDTPGGLLSSTRKTYESLLNANIPTAVYVSPKGGQAASAGTFITAAAHFAAMAPGTSIGAATPVGSGGEDLPDTLASKATNSAAADMRAIAEARGRNAEALESTVLKAKSFSAQEAVNLNVVDFIAEDMQDLLTMLDGREVSIGNRTVVLETFDVTIRDVDMSLFDLFLFILADPNISFILLTIGGLGIVIEVLNPGLIFPGVSGVLLLALAFASLGNLPVNWAGVGLIIFAGALVCAEFYVAGFGILGVGGLISFIVGSILLFSHFGSPSPTAPSLEVSLWILVPFAAILAFVGGWVLKTIAKPIQEQKTIEISPATGMRGMTVSRMAPRGSVRVNNEVWTAESSCGSIIEPGRIVIVIGRIGVTLIVTPIQESETFASSKGNQ